VRFKSALRATISADVLSKSARRAISCADVRPKSADVRLLRAVIANFLGNGHHFFVKWQRPVVRNTTNVQTDRIASQQLGKVVLDHLRARGASFEHELAGASGIDEKAVRAALRDLVAAGLVASDGFGGLRSIIRSATGRPGPAGRRSSIAGRWSLLRDAEAASDIQSAIELQARTLLKRYGVVFRRLLAREANVAPWRDLARVYRRLEARGEIRGGRFVAGFSGEQYALPDAIGMLRSARRKAESGDLVSVSGADPLNLVGVVTPGPRLAVLTGNRLLYRDGIPIALFAAGEVRFLETLDAPDEWEAHKALLRATGPERGGTKNLPPQAHGPLWVADQEKRVTSKIA
jgi:hypothetical protein